MNETVTPTTTNIALKQKNDNVCPNCSTHPFIFYDWQSTMNKCSMCGVIYKKEISIVHGTGIGLGEK